LLSFGGDEVDTRCWGPPPGTNSNITGSYSFDPDIWKWLQANGNLSSVGFRDMGSYNPATMQHYLVRTASCITIAQISHFSLLFSAAILQIAPAPSDFNRIIMQFAVCSIIWYIPAPRQHHLT
jgi:hypothetical protein